MQLDPYLRQILRELNAALLLDICSVAW